MSSPSLNGSRSSLETRNSPPRSSTASPTTPPSSPPRARATDAQAHHRRKATTDQPPHLAQTRPQVVGSAPNKPPPRVDQFSAGGVDQFSSGGSTRVEIGGEWPTGRKQGRGVWCPSLGANRQRIGCGRQAWAQPCGVHGRNGATQCRGTDAAVLSACGRGSTEREEWLPELGSNQRPTD